MASTRRPAVHRSGRGDQKEIAAVQADKAMNPAERKKALDSLNAELTECSRSAPGQTSRWSSNISIGSTRSHNNVESRHRSLFARSDRPHVERPISAFTRVFERYGRV
jgi:hypothetical protein